MMARAVLYEGNIATIYFEPTLDYAIQLVDKSSFAYYMSVLFVYIPPLIYHGFNMRYDGELGSD
ncbi:MAG: hypothetical protein ACK5LV_04265, partial [Lachnospirales bacterium]